MAKRERILPLEQFWWGRSCACINKPLPLRTELIILVRLYPMPSVTPWSNLVKAWLTEVRLSQNWFSYNPLLPMQFALIPSILYSLIKQVIIKWLLCARHFGRYWEIHLKKETQPCFFRPTILWLSAANNKKTSILRFTKLSNFPVQLRIWRYLILRLVQEKHIIEDQRFSTYPFLLAFDHLKTTVAPAVLNTTTSHQNFNEETKWKGRFSLVFIFSFF